MEIEPGSKNGGERQMMGNLLGRGRRRKRKGEAETERKRGEMGERWERKKKEKKNLVILRTLLY